MNTDELPPIALTLTDGTLCLRPWQERDADALADAVHESIDTVGRWLPWCRPDYGLDDAASWIAQCRAGWQTGDIFAFPVFHAASGKLLGSVGLSQHNRTHRSANLGYWVRQSHQREGIAQAAARLVARFGFEQVGLIRIEIVALADNGPSRHTAERLGAHYEALARQRLWAGGQARDACVYGLIPADLPAPVAGAQGLPPRGLSGCA